MTNASFWVNGEPVYSDETNFFWSNGEPYVVYEVSGVGEYTKTFTVDSLLEKSFTKTFTVDAIVGEVTAATSTVGGSSSPYGHFVAVPNMRTLPDLESEETPTEHVLTEEEKRRLELDKQLEFIRLSTFKDTINIKDYVKNWRNINE